MRYGRRCFALLCVWILTFAGVAVTGDVAFSAVVEETEPYTLIYHYSSSYLKEGKPVYSAATFRQIELFVQDDRTRTADDDNIVGELKIEPASFVCRDETGGRVDVVNGKVVAVRDQTVENGEDATAFPMRVESGNQEYVVFWPGTFFLRNAAENRDTGIPNKAFTWKLEYADKEKYSREETQGKFPDFLTTKEQLEGALPDVELTDSAVKLTIKMPYDGRFRVIPARKNGRLARTPWTSFTANEEISAEYLFTAFPDNLHDDRENTPINGGDIQLITIDIEPNSFRSLGGDYRVTGRYRWEFRVAKLNNTPVSGLGDISLQEGIKHIEDFARFAEGYKPGDRNVLFPFDVEDKSIFTFHDWDYDSTRYKYVDLKAYKSGQTTFTLLYEDTEGNWYYTSPINVTVVSQILDSSKPPEEAAFTSRGEVVVEAADESAITVLVNDEMAEDGVRKPDDGTEMRVWLSETLSETEGVSAASSGARPKAVEEYGPYTATTQDAKFTVNMNNLQPAKGATNAPEVLPEGNYSFVYQSTGGGWAGKGDQSVKVAGSGNSGSGGSGCDMGYSFLGFFLAAIVMKKVLAR